ncbi:permease-like cell division protein FtsX [Nonomuraea zeae]|nr:permease-like cell division protein FtsX [Nonomuraea zeae]
MPGCRESFVSEDQATAYENFKRAFKSQDALVKATKIADMPQSFRLTMRPETKWAKALSKLSRQPGVSQVVNPVCVGEQSRLRDHFLLQLPAGKVCPTGG